MTAAHSVIGASSMHRWGPCPGSVRMSKGIEKTTSKYAEEGTTAHEVASRILLGQSIADLLTATTDPDDPAYVSDDMLEAVEVYTKAFEEARQGSKFWVEERFDLSNLHPGLFGTSDGIIYHEDSKVLEVWDYKHGAGLGIEVEDNEQLMYYGLGALLKTKVPCSNVKLVICQPRYPHREGPVRSWFINPADLIDFTAHLIERAKATEEPDAPLFPGDHCRFCPAAGTCPALHSEAMAAAQMDFTPAESNYDPIKLADVLSKLPTIEAWIKNVRSFAYSEAERGRIPPGYKLTPKRATRKWRDEQAAKEFLTLELGLDPADCLKPSKLNTPPQIEAMLTNKADKELLNTLVLKESSGNNLVPEDSKGESVKPAIEAQFSKIE